MSWPHLTVSQAVSCRVAVRTGRVQAVSRTHAAVSQHCCLCPPIKLQKIVLRLNPCRARCPHVALLLRCVVGRCCAISQPLARCVATLGMPFLSRYNRMYHDTPQRPGHARSRCRSPRAQADRVVAPCLLCCDRVVAVS